jgi:hypothetical protein
LQSLSVVELFLHDFGHLSKSMAPSTVFTGRQEEVHLVADIAKTASTTAHADLQTALAAARERFTKRNPNSLRLHEEAAKSLPGGNTRSLLHTAPFPVYMKEGKGWQLVDEDGHTCVRFLNFSSKPHLLTQRAATPTSSPK